MKESIELIFYTLLLSAFWCYGFKTVFEKLLFKTVLGIEFDDYWDKLNSLEKAVFRPVFACPPCQASIHGTAIYFIFLYTELGLLMWVPFCFMLCGLNFILSQIGYEE